MSYSKPIAHQFIQRVCWHNLKTDTIKTALLTIGIIAVSLTPGTAKAALNRNAKNPLSYPENTAKTVKLPLKAAITLSSLFNDGMVLQRNKPVAIWGKAAPNAKVNISIGTYKVQAKAASDSTFMAYLPAMPANAVGQKLTIMTGKFTHIFEDVLVGDVYLASGQSNMEWKLSQTVNNYVAEIAAANYPKIRFFDVKNRVSSTPILSTDPKDIWAKVTPVTAPNFSAIAYFFARSVHKKYNIPVGVISAEWGGTPAQTWTSAAALSQLPEFEAQIEALKIANNNNTEAKQAAFEKEVALYKIKTAQADTGLQTRKTANNWLSPVYDDSKWAKMPVPGYWERTALPDFNGIIYFRYHFSLNAAQVANATINLGNVDDIDSTWVNGNFIGSIDSWNRNRSYDIAASALKTGDNVLVVKVIDFSGAGGFGAGQPADLYLATATGKVQLAGNWAYRIGTRAANMPPVPLSSKNQNNPTMLFNGMIAALQPYTLTGVIWYQGESNADKARSYEALFTAMILDWRKGFKQPKLPFMYCQLANYMAVDSVPAPESYWADLRAAQTATLAVPYTGMACLIDVGESLDIHPRDKQTPAQRLFAVAQRLCYNDSSVVFSGPEVASTTKEGTKLIVTFRHVGTGLVAKDKYGYVRGFAIKVDGGAYQYAKASVIAKDRVAIDLPQSATTVQVRYAWANNPEGCNLYNSAGLPTVPFQR